IYHNGLFQTGLFRPGNRLFNFRLDMLAAYPKVLHHTINALIENYIFDEYERLVCTASATPLATGIALKTEIPLVYSSGQSESARYDLIGAYDVGHPTCLIVNTLENHDDLQIFINKARGVGLDIRTIISVVALESPAIDNVEVFALYTLENFVDHLQKRSLLSDRQMQAILSDNID
ncbi:MAG: hypothetical protein ACPG7F_09805, partial [Aggregatilineales bacterium]